MQAENHYRRPLLATDPDTDATMYRLLVESVPDYAIFMLDPDGYVHTWNLGAQRIKGYHASEIIGRHFSLFYPPDVVARGGPEHVLATARGTGRFEDEGWRMRKDGTRFWANVVITRLTGEDGTLLGFAKITRDLSARREHEELLRRSEERFRLLVESVRDHAIFMLDPNGDVASWNAGAEAIKGYTAAEILGRHFSVFYPSDVVAHDWPARKLELALQDGRIEDEGWRVRKDGSRFWANVVITALHDASGRHIGFAKVTRDLTQTHRARALEDEGRRLTTFIAMLGHELRNPLAPIANAVSMLTLMGIDSEPVRMCRDVIDRQVRQLTRLVDDLLDVGRITAGKIHLELAPVELGRTLVESVEVLAPAASQRQHTITLELGDAAVWVRADPVRLLQVVQNLLHNAIKFTPPAGTIRVGLREDATHAEIAIRDNGPGIPPHRAAAIFDLFEQGESRTPAHEGGLGVGLNLVRQLVQLHGGKVDVISTGVPGEGAEFIVRLPRCALSDQTPATDDEALS
jgi:PAS domain S-box-containing protein